MHRTLDWLKDRKDAFDALQKLVTAVSVCAALVAGGFQAYEYLKAKRREADSSTALNSERQRETKKRVELYDRLGDFYMKKLESLEADITGIDSKLKEQVLVDTLESRIFKEVRSMKVQERADLYRAIWPQILEAKGQSR